MTLTLADILKLEAVVVGQPEVVVGADRLDRDVRWVHVAEIEGIGDLLEGGELILTTGLALTGPNAGPGGFLRQLSRAGVCGLIIELSPRLPEVPRSVIDEARRQDLPVIALHRTVQFVAITEAVHRRIVSAQYDDLAFAHRTHERFTALTLTGAGVDQIVSAAAELSGSPVVLEDLSHRALAFASMDQPEGKLLRDWERRSRRTPQTDGVETLGPEAWTTRPVGPAGSRWGRLIIVSPAVSRARLAMVLDRAADALQLTRMVEQNRADLWVRAQESLVDDLARGRVKSDADALARARSLRIEPGETYVPVAVHFPGEHTDGELRDVQDLRRETVAVSRALASTSVPALVGRLGPRTLGLVAVLPGDDDSPLTLLARALERESMFGEMPVIGVAASSGSLITAGARLHAAEHVADAARALTPREPRPYYRSTHVRLRGLIAQLRGDARALAFAESELGPLLAHDDEHDDDLTEVLRQFVACGGNKSRVATATHRSRPAVYSALARIERTLEVSLDDRESTLSLGVALLIHDQHRTSRRPAADTV